MTTTEPQGTGRKRGHSDPEGADSEPGKYQLIQQLISNFHKINSHSYH